MVGSRDDTTASHLHVSKKDLKVFFFFFSRVGERGGCGPNALSQFH